MNQIEMLISLLGVATAAVWAARRVDLPYPIFLLLAGVALGFVPRLPEIELDPDVIFLVFLPPLVHAAAWTSSPKHLRAAVRPLALLAFGNVFVTTAAVAVVAHLLIPSLGWGPAVVLGAIVAPTDTVAATTVFRRLGVPERVVLLVEGESLVNDGAALVVYRIAVAAVVTGTFSPLRAVGQLLVVGTGGAVVGLVVAFVALHVHRRLDDVLLSISVTLLTPYLAWIGAEQLHLSGVLAAVSSGLYLGWRSVSLFAPGTRLQANAFWETLTFMLESTLFILIGLEFPAVVDALEGRSALDLLGWSAAVAVTVIVARVVFQLTVVRLEDRVERRRGAAGAGLTTREELVVGWSGMRGAVSLAAALAIPLTTDAGTAFAQRDLILFLTLTTIGATLLLQGLTLPPLIRRLGIEDATAGGGRRRAVARFRTVQAALARIAELSFDEDVGDDAVERAREMYTARAQQLTAACRDGIGEGDGSESEWRALRRELIEIERAALIELRDAGRVNLATFREVQQDLDLEEQRLGRISSPDRPAAVVP